ncbi:unnamed protein product [Victoria cruziana]
MSVSLRASTRVSSGFTSLRHSSPSFGSRQACSHSNPSQKIKVGRQCNPQRDPATQFPCAFQVSTPVDSHTCQTPWSVFQDGPDGEPTGRCHGHAGTASSPPKRRAPHSSATATTFHERDQPHGLQPPLRPAPNHAPSRAADRQITVPHTTRAHRRPPSASLPAISSTF